MHKPRDYQLAAKAAVFADFARGSRSTLVVKPTGTGKTVLFTLVATEWQTGNVLVLAHRIELLDQAADKLAEELGYRPPIEQADRGVDVGLIWQGGNIVVGSVQTLRSDRRLEKFKRAPFGLIIVDEAHHATSQSYRKIVDACLAMNPDCRVLGVTATPRRADNAALGIVFDSVAYAMELQEAIELGWLVDVHQEYVQIDEVDFSNLSLTTNDLGESDFRPSDLEAILTEEQALHAIAKPILDKSEGGKQCLVFTAGVAHAHMLAAVLNRYRDDSAAAVDGKTDKALRREIIERFKSNRLQYLINFGVFTEGFDAPNTSVVVMARPTKSVGLYMQMLGRGTRPLAGVVDGIEDPEARRAAIAASPKPHMVVLDYVGNSKHKPVSSIDALGGNYDLETKALAERRVRESNGNANVMDELKKAKAEITLLREEQRRKGVKARDVHYSTVEVDVFGRGAAPVEQATGPHRGGSSDAQVAFLVNLGVQAETAAGYSSRQASAVIESLKAKRCTTKQANILTKYGYDPAVNFDAARKIIDAIAANGWKRPDDGEAA